MANASFCSIFGFPSFWNARSRSESAPETSCTLDPGARLISDTSRLIRPSASRAVSVRPGTTGACKPIDYLPALSRTVSVGFEDSLCRLIAESITLDFGIGPVGTLDFLPMGPSLVKFDENDCDSYYVYEF